MKLGKFEVFILKKKCLHFIKKHTAKLEHNEHGYNKSMAITNLFLYPSRSNINIFQLL
jgi:hypothetical protein